MLTKTLFILTGILTMSLACAQSTDVVGNNDVVKSIPVLKILADNVNSVYAELSYASTGSRSSANKTKTDYDFALNEYLKELENQLSLCNKNQTEALKSEITLVNQLLTGVITTPSR